jgi:hypothetical protein
MVFPFIFGRELQLICKKGLKNSNEITRVVLDTLLLASSEILSKWTRTRKQRLTEFYSSFSNSPEGYF